MPRIAPAAFYYYKLSCVHGTQDAEASAAEEVVAGDDGVDVELLAALGRLAQPNLASNATISSVSVIASLIM